MGLLVSSLMDPGKLSPRIAKTPLPETCRCLRKGALKSNIRADATTVARRHRRAKFRGCSFLSTLGAGSASERRRAKHILSNARRIVTKIR